MLLWRAQAVQAFVRQAMGYLNDTPDLPTRIELIKTLQSVTEGKVRATPTASPGAGPAKAMGH